MAKYLERSRGSTRAVVLLMMIMMMMMMMMIILRVNLTSIDIKVISWKCRMSDQPCHDDSFS